MYDHAEEVQMRLVGTVVTYDGRPFYCNQVTGRAPNLSVVGTLMPGRVLFTAQLRDPLLRWDNIRLGYVNRPADKAVYLYRVPARRGQQGLSQQNVRSSDTVRNEPAAFNFERLWPTAGFTEMMTNAYPTVEAAINVFNEDRPVVAFSRQFALERDDIGLYYLNYKGKRIGFTETGHDIRIAPAFKHLKDVCLENNIKVRA